MSSVINPAMQSVVQTFAPQQTQQNDDRNREERIEATTSAAGNSNVSLSMQAQNMAAIDLELAQHQQINGQAAVENPTTEANHTNNGLTYAANLQAQANFNAQQMSQADAQTDTKSDSETNS